MGYRALTWIKALFSDEDLTRLYERRQAHRPTEGNRTIATLLLATFLAFLLFSAIVSLFWVRRTEIAYLRSLSGVVIFPDDALKWSVRRAGPNACDKGCDVTALLKAPSLFAGRSVADFDYLAAKDAGAIHQDDLIVVSADVPAEAWAKLEIGEGKAAVLALPLLRYATATAYLDGEFLRRFYDAEPLGLGFLPVAAGASTLHIVVVVTPQPAQPFLFNGSRTSDVTFIAEQSRYRQYVEFAAGKQSGQGKQLADIARIVLAIFALLLFVFVDGSPECLGLAVFMAIKAVGVAFYQNWLPDWWTSVDFNRDIRNFLFCFGDIMQLFFFVQLARVARPVLRTWLLYGGGLAVIYAFGIHGNYSAFDIEWSEEIWRYRNIVIGVACLSVALAGARVCLKRRLWARASAMLVASSGTIVQIVYPIVKGYPPLFQTDVFQSLYFIWETHTPYVFAISAFINLSTMERRVKALSSELISTKETERDRALSETVNETQLPVPELPTGVDLAIHQGGGRDLAKDAYYLHWHPGGTRLAFLVHAYSGVGVAPALKGAACVAIGDTVWTSKGDDGNADTRFNSYDGKIQDYMQRVYRGQELAPFVGCELDTATRRLTLFRADGAFPLMVERMPGVGRSWVARIVATASRCASTGPLRQEAFVVLMSGGLRVNGRELRDFQRYLQHRLDEHGDVLDAETLKAMILAYVAFTGTDRTMVTLHVGGRAAA